MPESVRFNDLLINPEVFQSLFPDSFRCWIKSGLPQMPDGEDKRLTEFFFRNARSCFDNGSEVMRSYIYLRWAASQQGVTADEVCEFTPASQESLPPPNQALW